MKILLVSDSHGNTSFLTELYEKYSDCDLYLHAGDSEDMEYALFPFESVRGNCDHYPFMFGQRIFTTPAGPLFMRHINYYDQKNDPKCRIFVHGHTHKVQFENKGNYLEICPGSISYSRSSYEETYLILEIEKTIIIATFFDKKHNVVLIKNEVI